MNKDDINAAEVAFPVKDLRAELAFFTEQLGFRLDTIFPADDPAVAVISGYGVRLRLDRHEQALSTANKLRILCDNPDQPALTSPNGIEIDFAAAKPALVIPKTQHSFQVTKFADSDSWIIGRAGMHYRDLIPDRLGGAIIASHIRIPNGGPVPDMVHFHTISFQLIFCYKGWVDLVYEDQGPPFRLIAGDCVIQPPEIRHRVLEASDNLEVIEIGVPADHITTIDHELDLPTSNLNPQRDFQGTTFVHHKQVDASWQPWRLTGFESRDTGIGAATQGIAGVHVIRTRPIQNLISQPSSHNADIIFSFITHGTMTLQVENQIPHELAAGDAFVIPPNLKTEYINFSSGYEFIEVSLGAEFDTF